MTDFVKLREIAEKATPGPWSHDRADDPSASFEVFGHDGSDYENFVADCRIGQANAEFIATFDPPMVLSLLADRARMEKALREAEEVLAMAALMPMVDPVHGDEVEALGLRIGFGALMSSAQASWRQQADVKGGEFVAGPCFATVIETLKTIRQALGASQ